MNDDGECVVTSVRTVTAGAPPSKKDPERQTRASFWVTWWEHLSQVEFQVFVASQFEEARLELIPIVAYLRPIGANNLQIISDHHEACRRGE